MPILVEIGPVVSREDDENVKNLQTDRRMTGNQKAHKSFQLRWAKNRDLMAHIGIWEALMKNFHLFYARLAVFVFDETLKW